MKKLTDRIRHHNAWRRSEHDEMCNVTQLGRDLCLIADEHDKLTEQNKMLQTRIDMFTKTINQIADSVSAGVCAGVDTDGDISHTAEVIIGAQTKLAEQNKMMIEVLKLIAKIAEHTPVDKLILKEANQALEATK